MLIRRKRPCINVEIWVYLDSSDFEANRLEQHTNAAGNDAFPHPADHSAANKDVLHGHTRECWTDGDTLRAGWVKTNLLRS